MIRMENMTYSSGWIGPLAVPDHIYKNEALGKLQPFSPAILEEENGRLPDDSQQSGARKWKLPRRIIAFLTQTGMEGEADIR